MSRKKLIEELGTREDGNFELFNLVELKKLIQNGDNKKNWHCLGRQNEREGNTVNYCVYAYSTLSNETVKGCTEDCIFYKKIHNQ
ncbi:MAG: hypothetical protein WD876_04070 [Candidatus Pacearchaeota archaeon]